MRVAYLLKRYPRYSETFIVNEILAHEEAGMEIEIFALRPPLDTHFQAAISRVRAPVTYISNDGVKATKLWDELRLGRSSLPGLRDALDVALMIDATSVRQALLLALELIARRIDHVHAHFATVATTVARLAALFANTTYTFTAHAKDIFHESVDPAELMQKLSGAETVVTVSEYNRRLLESMKSEAGLAGAEDTGIARIYNGLDLDRYSFHGALHAPEPGPPLLLAVGRLVEKKGFRDLIDACAILKQKGLDFACRIIGTGDLRAELEAQIVELGLSGAVELVGPLPSDEVAAWMRRATIFAAPCVIGADGNRDGLPMTVLEAMALGTPVIATGVTGLPEVLRDGETGLMIPENDPPALATAVATLLDDPGQRDLLTGAARAVIEQDFDLRTSAAELRAVFDRAVKAGCPVAAAS